MPPTTPKHLSFSFPTPHSSLASSIAFFEMLPFQLLTAFASAALLVSAGPAFKDPYCDTSTAKLDLPSNQTELVTPTTAPLFVTLGVGVQNYTCNASTLAYTSVAAPPCTIALTYLFILAPSAPSRHCSIFLASTKPPCAPTSRQWLSKFGLRCLPASQPPVSVEKWGRLACSG